MDRLVEMGQERDSIHAQILRNDSEREINYWGKRLLN